MSTGTAGAGAGAGTTVGIAPARRDVGSGPGAFGPEGVAGAAAVDADVDAAVVAEEKKDEDDKEADGIAVDTGPSRSACARRWSVDSKILCVFCDTNWPAETTAVGSTRRVRRPGRDAASRERTGVNDGVGGDRGKGSRGARAGRGVCCSCTVGAVDAALLSGAS